MSYKNEKKSKMISARSRTAPSLTVFLSVYMIYHFSEECRYELAYEKQELCGEVGHFLHDQSPVETAAFELPEETPSTPTSMRKPLPLPETLGRTPSHFSICS